MQYVLLLPTRSYKLASHIIISVTGQLPTLTIMSTQVNNIISAGWESHAVMKMILWYLSMMLNRLEDGTRFLRSYQTHIARDITCHQEINFHRQKKKILWKQILTRLRMTCILISEFNDTRLTGKALIDFAGYPDWEQTHLRYRLL